MLGPETYKQSLGVKCLKAKARAEKANKLKTKFDKSEHKLRQVQTEN